MVEKTPAEWEIERQKCIDSPLYFYNNYVIFPGKRNLTQEEWDDQISARQVCSRLRRRDYPMAIDECFKKEEDGNSNI